MTAVLRLTSLRSPTGRALTVFLLFAASALPAGASTDRRPAGDGMFAVLIDSKTIFLEAPPRRGEGWLGFSQRLTGTTRHGSRIARANGARRILSGRRYRIPLHLLRGDLQLRTLQALFPQDGPQVDGWRHRVEPSHRGHSLWQIAVWFTGKGENFEEIRRYNGLSSGTIRPGQELLIPPDVLLPPFRAALAKAVPPHPDLEYERGRQPAYAVYRLKKGEALYSSVVVRFTGRAFADDVNQLAGEIARFSGISDVTDIAVGREIKIPLEWLAPEHLPPGDPKRTEWERARAESAGQRHSVRASRLEGITVILDAGHGGADPGAMRGNVWESVYVYDIMLRLKQLLESTTAARVRPLVRDGEQFRIHDRDVLPISRRHAILTSPLYPIADAKTGTHLRWYLANSLYREALKRSSDQAKTIFLSIHADSLHPSLRGAMAYIPAAELTRGTYGKREQVYRARAEVRQRPQVSYTWKERVKSEGLSRQLAESLIASYRRRGLPVHPQKAVRDRIIRRKSQVYVPAVIRYNAVPSKVLFEVGNLSNSQDRALLQTRSYRQKVAHALAEGILDYYGQTAPPPPQVAAQ